MKERLFTRDQIRGCIFGGAVGDALGYPVEFLSRMDILHRFGDEGITDYCLNSKGEAEISDDTQMTLYTATGMLFASTRGHTHGIAGYPEMYIWRHYADWYMSQTDDGVGGIGGSWLAWDERMRVRRAPGNTCMSALRDLIEHGEGNRVRNNSKGCGGVMRVAPVAITNEFPCQSEAEMVTLGSKVADITHNHPLGTLPAAAMVMILRRIVTGHCPQDRESFARLVSNVAYDLKNIRTDYGGETYGELYPEETKQFKEMLLRAVLLSTEPISDAEGIARLGEGWVADEALAIALFCALRHIDSFEKAVIAAVNHDGDSDSTGAICGNIMGLFVGERGIPQRFLERLEVKDLISEVCDDVYYGCRISEYSNLERISDEDAREWDSKYIFSVRRRDWTAWDGKECKRRLEEAFARLKNTHDEGAYDEVRKIRREVFLDTVKVSRQGRYTDSYGRPNGLHYPDDFASRTVFYDKEIPQLEPVMKKHKTGFHVVNRDCLEIAHGLDRPAVLNMASRRNPGGGVLNGAGAQEESLFRRTDLFRSLYMFSKENGSQFGIRQRKEQYPLDRNFGGIYSLGVNVFRGSEKFGYPFEEWPDTVDVISVAGMNRPELKDPEHIADSLVPFVKNKMRTILRIAAVHGHDTLVLGALGCGAFRNPPAHIARLFHEVFEEKEFKGRFKCHQSPAGGQQPPCPKATWSSRPARKITAAHHTTPRQRTPTTPFPTAEDAPATAATSSAPPATAQPHGE